MFQVNEQNAKENNNELAENSLETNQESSHSNNDKENLKEAILEQEGKSFLSYTTNSNNKNNEQYNGDKTKETKDMIYPDFHNSFLQDIDQESYATFTRAKPEDKIFLKLDIENPELLIYETYDCENWLQENFTFLNSNLRCI